LLLLALVAVLGGVGFWRLSAPERLPPEAMPAHQADIANGKLMFTIGGCINCHRPPKDQANANPDLPSGGAPLKTPIGILYPPNLTPDPDTGIGKWTHFDFLDATMRGVSPKDTNYIPAFPYTSYSAMKAEDLLDIEAYLMSLPAVKSPAKSHDIWLVPVVRRGVGLWKRFGLDTTPWQPDTARSPSWNRGSYLVNGPGHCGECHTARNIFMIKRSDRQLSGGPHPEGEGRVPSLRNLIARSRYKDANDLASAMQYGETLGFDKLSSGGMGDVQAELAKLPASDVQAIAEYLVSLE
jgi:mono/diheme cytochrome c family protein